MFNFFRSQKSKRNPDTEIIKKVRERQNIDQYIEKYRITKNGVRNEFLENNYNFTEFSSGLSWIFAIRLLDSLYDDEYIAERVSGVSKDIIFFECIYFILLSPLSLYNNGFLVEDEFETFYETIDAVSKEVEQLFNISVYESEEVQQVRVELLFDIPGHVEDYFNATCSQFSKIIRTRADLDDNEIVNTKIKEYHIAIDHDRAFGFSIQVAAEDQLRKYINILKSAIFDPDDY